MPTGILGAASIQDVRETFIRTQTALEVLGVRDPGAPEERLCYVVDGDCSNAIKMPFSLSNAKIGDIDPSKGRGYRDMTANVISCPQGLFGMQERQGLLYDQLMGDRQLHNAFGSKQLQVAIDSALWWRLLLAKTMQAAGNSYDGAAFYGTHAGGTNDGGTLDINKANLVTVYNLLAEQKTDNGQTRLNAMREVYAVVSSRADAIAIRELIQAKQTAVAVGANAAVALDNQLPKELNITDVITITELGNFGDPKYWFLVDSSDAIERAYLMGKGRAPELGFDGLSPNDHSRKERYSVEWWIDGWGGAAKGLHQKVVRAKKS